MWVRHHLRKNLCLVCERRFARGSSITSTADGQKLIAVRFSPAPYTVWSPASFYRSRIVDKSWGLINGHCLISYVLVIVTENDWFHSCTTTYQSSLPHFSMQSFPVISNRPFKFGIKTLLLFLLSRLSITLNDPSRMSGSVLLLIVRGRPIFFCTQPNRSYFAE